MAPFVGGRKKKGKRTPHVDGMEREKRKGLEK